MKAFVKKNFKNSLPAINKCKHIHYQLSPDELVQQTLTRKQGVLSDTGALCIGTGAFTGRCPQDKFIVKDELTANTVNWSKFNIPVDERYFLQLREKMLQYLSNREEVWMRDVYACADETYRLNIRVINEYAWSNLFCYNMFLRPTEDGLKNFEPEWHLIQAPGFTANPVTDGTRSPQFAIISFTHKTILIGGTGYTGEMKKGIFTVLNYILPCQHKILSMHCSANTGREGDVAIFFGLSGTGKTTLSADPERRLIGDDEHGWTSNSIFNFEGGCYAKTINLSKEKEPAIYTAVKEGALAENTVFVKGTNKIDFASDAITENTRVSYPLHYIANSLEPSIGSVPKHIFFLTCDAYGVLPPVSKLTPAQAMYQFISGYTAKIAGTETGITEPKVTFSACFGAPFLPLHPVQYAKLLGRKIKTAGANVWLINTGWTGGPYGIGKRIALKDTRAIISAILNDSLKYVTYEPDEVFGMMIPRACYGVDAGFLKPRNTWADKDAYDDMASELARMFHENFHQYTDETGSEIALAAPMVLNVQL